MAFVTLRMLALYPKVKVSYVAEVDSAKLSEINRRSFTHVTELSLREMDGWSQRRGARRIPR